MPKSAKDQCFEDALQSHEDATGKKLPVESQRGWVQDKSGKWAELPEESTFGKILGSIMKTLRINNGTALPRADGAPNPVQLRYPDLTVTKPDGSKVVVDNKFTDRNGQPDGWRTTQGTNKTTQRDDYNDINKQNTNGDPKAKDLTLDKNKCGCEGEPKGEEVPVPVPGMVMVPGVNAVPMPFQMPSFSGGGLAPEPIFPPGLLPAW